MPDFAMSLVDENKKLKATIRELELKCAGHSKIEGQQHLKTSNLAWLEYSPACTKVVDRNFNLQYMSSAGIQGLCIEDITPFYNKPYPFDFYPDAFKHQMAGTLSKAKKTGIVQTQEGLVLDTNGQELWFHSTIVPIKDEQNKLDYFIIVSINVTERKKAEDRLKQLNMELEQRIENRTKELEEANRQLRLLSETDALTMIANRRVYSKRLQEEVSRMHRTGEYLSLLVIDVDNFKHYNDTYGHDFGDIVLKQVAKVIQDSLPRSIDFVARIGGEEFAVILSSTDAEGATYVAEKIRYNIQAEAINHSSENTVLTVSIGISTQDNPQISADKLFHQADRALYAAKGLGRNRVELYLNESSLW